MMCRGILLHLEVATKREQALDQLELSSSSKRTFPAYLMQRLESTGKIMSGSLRLKSFSPLATAGLISSFPTI